MGFWKTDPAEKNGNKQYSHWTPDNALKNPGITQPRILEIG
jgi:hypothetical protein